MWDAQTSIATAQKREVFRTVLHSPTPVSDGLRLVGDADTMTRDIQALFQQNACNSAGLKRFQENLRLFAFGKQPIRMDGSTTGAVAVAAPQGGASFKDSDYKRFLEDVIADQSKSWVLNKYVAGSTAFASVDARNRAGRPSLITAHYAYIDFSSRRGQGTVTLRFDDGTPECLFFFDAPNDCRSPNRKLVAAYAARGYY